MTEQTCDVLGPLSMLVGAAACVGTFITFITEIPAGQYENRRAMANLRAFFLALAATSAITWIVCTVQRQDLANARLEPPELLRK